MPRRTGGQLIVDALLRHGTDLIFCVPGESFLGTLDALHDHGDKIRLIAARHEAAAVNMAEAAGKLTGRPGIAFVTRGPGATQGSVGVHTAFHDSTPLILFIGQVARAHMGREAFQEVDFEKFFAPISKWAVQVNSAADLPGAVAEAFHVAMSGRRGPVVVALPEDIQTDSVEAAAVAPKPVARPEPAAAQMEQARNLLAAARQPLVILGGSGWTNEGLDALRRFVEHEQLAVVTSFRRKDLFDNGHAQYAGDLAVGQDPRLVQRLKDADLILAVGTRLSDITTGGFKTFTVPKPKQRLVHIHPDQTVLNKVYQADVAIAADLNAAAEKLAGLPPTGDRPWSGWTAAARADYQTYVTPVPSASAIDLAAIFAELPRRLPADAIITNGAGNYAGWHHRYFVHRKRGTYLGPTSGAMGYGVPAALAAKAVHPDRVVIAMAGDGCFQMASPELATARQHDLPIVVLVFNNGMYGTIRMHQEKHYPGRITATDLANPDFAALARAHGGHGETVTTTAAFWPALDRCLDSGKVSLIDMHTDPDAIATNTTLTALRDAAKS